MKAVSSTSTTYSSEYNPAVELQNVEFNAKRAKTAWGSSEVEIPGNSSILVADSEKYGKELVFQNYSSNFNLSNRGNESDWNRTELFFDLMDAPQIALAIIKLYEQEVEELMLCPYCGSDTA